MEPHARYEDETWEGVDLAGLEAGGVELRDMELAGAFAGELGIELIEDE